MKMSIPNAMVVLERVMSGSPGSTLGRAANVALIALDYSIGSRIDCDSCGAMGQVTVGHGEEELETVECPICDGYGHADPEVVKATWGEWPTYANAVQIAAAAIATREALEMAHSTEGTSEE